MRARVLAVVSVLVIGVGLVALLTERRERPEGPAAPSATSSPGAAEGAGPAELEVPLASAPRIAEAPLATHVAQAADDTATEPAPPPLPPGGLRVRVLDARGAPAGGVRVALVSRIPGMSDGGQEVTSAVTRAPSTTSRTAATQTRTRSRLSWYSRPAPTCSAATFA